MSDSIGDVAIKIISKHAPEVSSLPIQDVGQTDGINNDLMMSYFRLNPMEVSQEVSRKLSEIYGWASARSTDKEDSSVLNVLRDVKYRLGSPKLGITDIDHIYNYVRFRSESERFAQRAEAMEA